MEDSRKIIARWCRHSDTKIMLEDKTEAKGPELMNEPPPRGRPTTEPRREGLRIAKSCPLLVFPPVTHIAQSII